MFGLGLGAGSQSNQNSSTIGAGNGQNNGLDSDGKSNFVQKYLTNCRSFYSCIYCRTHLANHDELVSRSFQGNRSRAYLFNTVINISCGPSVQRALNTGAHAVADIFCTNCGTTMGWKYERAYVESQKYKEGKYIIELAHVVRENRHLEFDQRDMLVQQGLQLASTNVAASSPSTLCGSLSPPNSGVGSLADRPHLTSTYLSSNQDRDRESPGLDEFALEDDEAELMFPFYDDLMQLDRSSYPSCSSSMLYNSKARRSFYLDSTPYDWKYSGSQIGNGPKMRQKLALPDGSLTSSNASPSSSACSSSSSPSSSSPGDPQPPPPPPPLPPSSSSSSTLSPATHATTSRAVGNVEAIVATTTRANVRQPPGSSTGAAHKMADDQETQFKFEAETDTDNDDCDQQPSSASMGEPNTSCDRANDDENSPEQVSLATSNSSANNGAQAQTLASPSTAYSLNFDDEEFYDCCTDHEVSNSATLSH